MSFQAMTWAVGQNCKNSSQKLVLLMLANCTNGHTGQCNPSHKTLAKECCMSVSSLKSQIKKLSDDGYLSIVYKSLDGVNLPNQYILNLEGVGQILADGGSNSGGGVGQILATNQELMNQENKQEDKPGKEPKEQPHEKKAKNKKHRITSDWIPDEKCKELLAKSEIPLDYYSRLISEFIYYWESRGELRCDWGPTFLNHVKRQWEFNGQSYLKKNQNSNGKLNAPGTKVKPHEINSGFSEKYAGIC